MSSQTLLFDLGNLEARERALREALKTRPEDMDLRLRLAWCLFMEALHRAGEEAALRALDALPSGPVEPVLRDRNALAMLTDCLDQAYTVLHLSDQVEARRDVAQIEALVQLSGASPLTLQSQARAQYRLTDLLQAIGKSEDVNAPAE